jgi:hypothetical protein
MDLPPSSPADCWRAGPRPVSAAGSPPDGPRRQARVRLRPRTASQFPVESRRQASGRDPVPQPQTPEGEAAEIVFQQDIHRVVFFGVTHKLIISVMHDL